MRAARVRVAGLQQALARSPHSLFLRELVAHPKAVGALCASSPHLAARMARWVDPAVEGLVVELGGGTGVITQALLARGIPPERLAVVEHSGRLVAHLRARFPQAIVLHGDAADLPALLARAGHLPHVGHIVSGLPLLSIAPACRQRIVQAAVQALAPGGRLLQFTYALAGPSPWQQAGLVRRRSERVLANLPPARVDLFTPLAPA